MYCRAFLSTVLLLLAACGSGEPAPAGYVDACYGGNFSKALAGRTAFLTADVDIPESDWPKLATLMNKAAANGGVSYFNDTRHNEGLSMILVSLCSPDGLFLMADKRVWKDSEKVLFPDSPVLITAYAYKNEATWLPFAGNLIETLKREWPDRVTVPSKRTAGLKNSQL